MKKIDRTGEKGINKFGSEMLIKEYRNNRDIDVYFPEYDWVFEHAQYQKFKDGEIKCPYERRYYGKGYLGEGKYRMSENGKITDGHNIWYNMLKRCYDPKYQERYPSYKGCEVEKYLLNFQNMSEWLDKNYYKVPGEKMCFDKDILFKGNKVYSRNTCSLVPPETNSLFENLSYRKYKNELPIGVRPQNKKYQAFCRDRIRGNTYLGTSDTPEGAFILYKIYKENLIKKTADEFKWCLPENVYTAMYNYEININD